MTTSSGIAATASGVALHSHTLAVSNAASSSSSLNEHSKSTPQTPNQGISPKIYFDPLAGQVTQFFNGAGETTIQIPSQTVVAYLRAGLAADGYAKPSKDEFSKA